MRNGLEIIKINRKISFNYYLNDEIIVKGDISNGCLWNFETDYNYRRRGYGSLALNEILNYLFNENKYKKISLYCYSFNIVAINLYKKFGFKQSVFSKRYSAFKYILEKENFRRK